MIHGRARLAARGKNVPDNPRLPPVAARRTAAETSPRVTNGPAGLPALDFALPPDLEAAAPPEARGLPRDGVRLLVSRGAGTAPQLTHTCFGALPAFLEPGDVLAINTSGTLNAAPPARRADGAALELHLSTRLPAGLWSVEVRRPQAGSTVPFYTPSAGETLQLPAGASVTLHAPQASPHGGRVRLWLATLNLPGPLAPYLAAHGFPIRYNYVPRAWPGEYYQTVYATEPGSAEMPSAGRAFTPELITRLVARGVQVAPLLLHTGVASLQDHEPPYEEYYRVPAATAQLVNAARAAGQRVVAVGTTTVRALETTAEARGLAHPGEGWTDLIISPDRLLRVVNGLLTGFHEPNATHLAMLAAVAGLDRLRAAYAAALRERYLWHEFGDLHLILP
ncbi:MAG: S-adenosylmethionine:tRNA ribosyltransferase-isomerase [Anaerolineales bacterium]|nr:S-adenosylmethionine:tRNA ribosyltransferase-isomerase [Anaerolineales bacterium]